MHRSARFDGLAIAERNALKVAPLSKVAMPARTSNPAIADQPAAIAGAVKALGRLLDRRDARYQREMQALQKTLTDLETRAAALAAKA